MLSSCPILGQRTPTTPGPLQGGHLRVTPTALAPTELVRWLALFEPKTLREHALILDPSKIELIRGPAWIRLGQGIEYYLPSGFPKEAIVDVGVIEVS